MKCPLALGVAIARALLVLLKRPEEALGPQGSGVFHGCGNGGSHGGQVVDSWCVKLRMLDGDPQRQELRMKVARDS